MAYTTPVTDRTAADIAARNSKAYMNVTDWQRIQNNADYLNDWMDTLVGVTFPFPNLGTAVNTWILRAEYELNPLLEVIEGMRLWAATYIPELVSDPDFVEIRDDWLSGPSGQSPTYIQVNDWEKVMDILNDAFTDYAAGMERAAVCGVADCGSGLTRQFSWR